MWIELQPQLVLCFQNSSFSSEQLSLFLPGKTLPLIFSFTPRLGMEGKAGGSNKVMEADKENRVSSFASQRCWLNRLRRQLIIVQLGLEQKLQEQIPGWGGENCGK